MTLNQRIEALSQLGNVVNHLDEPTLEELILRARAENPWFTAENVMMALRGVSRYLDGTKLEQWISIYETNDQGKLIGLVMAGNIPLVGFHDLICVLVSGNIAKVKLSSKDQVLIRFMVSELFKINETLTEKIIFADRLNEMDAVIATGSDNSARYFDYYFSKYPNIIRKNRTSIAVIDGSENIEQLRPLGVDIFSYFGHGCRNVSKLYVPEGYNFNDFFASIEENKPVIDHHKYANNYDYNKSIYLVNKEPHFDNGFLLLRKDSGLVSPISVIYYEEYKSKSNLDELIKKRADKIQCIVSNDGDYDNSYKFGGAQFPELWDYADNVDTMEFLVGL